MRCSNRAATAATHCATRVATWVSTYQATTAATSLALIDIENNATLDNVFALLTQTDHAIRNATAIATKSSIRATVREPA